jgi:hypothetical protein
MKAKMFEGKSVNLGVQEGLIAISVVYISLRVWEAYIPLSPGLEVQGSGGFKFGVRVSQFIHPVEVRPVLPRDLFIWLLFFLLKKKKSRKKVFDMGLEFGSLASKYSAIEMNIAPILKFQPFTLSANEVHSKCSGSL